MAKARNPLTFEAAALAVLSDMGVAEIATLLDRSERAVRFYSDPDHDGRPTIHQCLSMDVAYARLFGGRAPFLLSYRTQLEARLTGLAVAGDLVQEALDVPQAVGRLVGKVRQFSGEKSRGGSRITPAEARLLLAEIQAVRAELDDLERILSGQVGT